MCIIVRIYNVHIAKDLINQLLTIDASKRLTARQALKHECLLKYSISQIKWKNERLLWIAYIKNQNNCKLCLLATLSKDIIKLILSFLKIQHTHFIN